MQKEKKYEKEKSVWEKKRRDKLKEKWKGIERGENKQVIMTKNSENAQLETMPLIWNVREQVLVVEQHDTEEDRNCHIYYKILKMILKHIAMSFMTGNMRKQKKCKTVKKVEQFD